MKTFDITLIDKESSIAAVLKRSDSYLIDTETEEVIKNVRVAENSDLQTMHASICGEDLRISLTFKDQE